MSDITTIFFDMDSTIISINEEAFSRNYFKLLHKKHFSEFSRKSFFETMVDVTRTVMLTPSPEELTLETFMRELSEKFTLSEEDLLDRFMTFYGKEYNRLKRHVKPQKMARKVLELCFEMGLDIVVATTPVFPEIAITKRLEWGKIDHFDYLYVTHAENMHYSKPQADYYSEILAATKKEVAECIMVGNEFLGDIVGPFKIGMKTFYCPLPSVNDALFYAEELKRFSKVKPTHKGTLQDLYLLLENGFK